LAKASWHRFDDGLSAQVSCNRVGDNVSARRLVPCHHIRQAGSVANQEDHAMTISMYAASIPIWKHMLGNLSVILRKAAEHVQSRKIDEQALLRSRLFPDMFPLIKQVQIVTDQAKGGAARLAGIEVPKYEDEESTFEHLQARLSKTIAFLDSIDPAQVDGSENRDIVLQFGSRKSEYKGQDYLLKFVNPNFYFHLATAYGLLRHGGVELGKKDFVGA
jgi:uncharacterized protein